MHIYRRHEPETAAVYYIGRVYHRAGELALPGGRGRASYSGPRNVCNALSRAHDTRFNIPHCE